MDRVLESEHFKPRQIRLITTADSFSKFTQSQTSQRLGALTSTLVSSKVDRVSSIVREEIWKYTKNVQILRKRGLLGEKYALSGAMLVRAPYISL
jgi:hypothetical protein